MKLKGNITIGLNNSHGVCRIEMEDESSGIQFLRMELSKEDFYNLLSGRACVPCEFNINKIENIGSKKIRKQIVFPAPKYEWVEKRTTFKSEAEKYISNNAELDGFEVEDLFNSQRTTFYKDGQEWVRCNIAKYVKREKNEN